MKQMIKKYYQLFLRSKFFTAIMYIYLAVLLFVLIIGNVMPQKVDVKLLGIAPKTIHSPITTVDNEATKEKRKEASLAVKDQYAYSEIPMQVRLETVNTIFLSISESKTAIRDKYPDDAIEEIPNHIKLEILKKKIPKEVSNEIEVDLLVPLLEVSDIRLSTAKELLMKTIKERMKEPISIDTVSEARAEAKSKIEESSLPVNIKLILIELANTFIVHNYTFDSNATKEAKQLASDAVEPVKILQGQVIVKQGEIITKEAYQQLKLVGLLDGKTSYLPFVGLVTIIGVFILLINFFFRDEKIHLDKRKPNLLMFIIIATIIFALMKVISLSQPDSLLINFGYLTPVAMAAMLVKLTISDRLSTLMSLLVSFGAGIMFNEGMSGSINFSVAFYVLLSGIAGAIFLEKKNRRMTIIRSSFYVILFNLVILFSLFFLQNTELSNRELFIYFTLGVLSGVLTAVLTLGILPLLEDAFGFISTFKLMELSNPNHPLLRKILTEAPGTYHHSLMVANLAEAGAESIGANGLLTRVGAYYHDIGKTVRPQFFIENQMNMKNPHDRINHNLSSKIIISHVRDGEEILLNNKMPKNIIDIAKEHHGTTLIKYFYVMEKKENPDASEEDFRYPGPKPQTKESAIVGIADSVEAAVRSLHHPTIESIEQLVNKIVEERLLDGQFSQCDLTFAELEKVKNTMIETLTGLFHNRIEYPELDQKE